jgi:hypothetical protein
MIIGVERFIKRMTLDICGRKVCFLSIEALIDVSVDWFKQTVEEAAPGSHGNIAYGKAWKSRAGVSSTCSSE